VEGDVFSRLVWVDTARACGVVCLLDVCKPGALGSPVGA